MGIAGTYNITADQGATFSRVLTYTDSAGDPIDLSGYSARMQVRSIVSSDTTVLELTTDNGRITLGGAAGTVTLSVPASAMDDVAGGSYAYDLELVNGITVTRLVMGSFTVRAEVTR